MYEYPVYRPPSEAHSLILQITSGCSYNRCEFCTMYKGKTFRVKSPEAIEAHLQWAREQFPFPERIFLADGNVLCLKTERILELLRSVRRHFPAAQRIASYAGPLDLLRKTPRELEQIRTAGLELLYLGVESGSDTVLQLMNKGVSSEEMVEAGQKAKQAGFQLSCMIISGLGGKAHLQEHAVASAQVISKIQPDYFALLTLMVEPESPLKKRLEAGSFQLLSPFEVMEELKLLLERVELDHCVFRANHASNYINLKGILNQDRDAFLEQIEAGIRAGGFKPEQFRQL